jgi:uncharacterized protein YjiS (DUF1127 family)
MGQELLVSLFQINTAYWDHQTNIKSGLMKSRRPAMSAITFSPASSATGISARALFHRLIAAQRPQGRLYRSLKDLPDHLLLDIGVDPRDVPARTETLIARPDLAFKRIGAAGLRTAAKS